MSWSRFILSKNFEEQITMEVSLKVWQQIASIIHEKEARE
jgi:hypothetical protein